jgi:hypothetical protein
MLVMNDRTSDVTLYSDRVNLWRVALTFNDLFSWASQPLNDYYNKSQPQKPKTRILILYLLIKSCIIYKRLPAGSFLCLQLNNSVSTVEYPHDVWSVAIPAHPNTEIHIAMLFGSVINFLRARGIYSVSRVANQTSLTGQHWAGSEQNWSIRRHESGELHSNTCY